MATQSTANGTTTLTSYIGSIEEVQTTGSSTQTTTYYAVAGERVAADVNGTFYYFGYDALGSQVAVLNATGSLVGAQLYGPYGASRYNTGTLPTSIGFTGQRADTITGLDYYNARYYDPIVGQFLSVDRVQGNAQGMDPYAYVGGNPESRTDPTGNSPTCSDDGSCNDGAGGGGNSGADLVVEQLISSRHGRIMEAIREEVAQIRGAGEVRRHHLSMVEEAHLDVIPLAKSIQRTGNHERLIHGILD